MTGSDKSEFVRRESDLIVAIGKAFPDFARARHAEDIPVILLHQDAFAADYQEEEYRLMGMAIKFAGIYGKRGFYSRQKSGDGESSQFNSLIHS